MINQLVFSQYIQSMHQSTPLVHCITNDVVANFTANVLLAIGASPAMVVAEEEATDFARIASALLINVGTLTAIQAKVMQKAVEAANEAHTPWVLDPVAAGALSFRTVFCQELLHLKPAVIRGNASEIAALNGDWGTPKGADSVLRSDEVLQAAKNLALKYQTVVTVTGQTDYVTDGQSVYALKNGSALLTRVTGTGCALGAMVAAYCAVCHTPLEAALVALSHMAIAGEMAAEHHKGVGSFAVALLDQLSLLAQNDDAQQRLKCQKI